MREGTSNGKLKGGCEVSVNENISVLAPEGKIGRRRNPCEKTNENFRDLKSKKKRRELEPKTRKKGQKIENR